MIIPAPDGAVASAVHLLAVQPDQRPAYPYNSTARSNRPTSVSRSMTATIAAIWSEVIEPSRCRAGEPGRYMPSH